MRDVNLAANLDALKWFWIAPIHHRRKHVLKLLAVKANDGGGLRSHPRLTAAADVGHVFTGWALVVKGLAQSNSLCDPAATKRSFRSQFCPSNESPQSPLPFQPDLQDSDAAVAHKHQLVSDACASPVSPDCVNPLYVVGRRASQQKDVEHEKAPKGDRLSLYKSHEHYDLQSIHDNVPRKRLSC
jgi:hypothetical protein